ncbi:DUF58 domain-containing protein [Dokdonella sp.]|uniref:DUF58 domain-containing protein n=1 Tax=Dokdonella sp. TaxID=2291710 RepID=UPI001B079743|nr:DUF58 domain-containing protein [Dokdonella sp.]MBO9662703.1 DUF58 domain-containing protein [Dokdonella sp.]
MSAAATLRARLLAEAERRLPALTRLRRAEALPVALDRRRIYVLPTGFGAAFTLLLFVMLLGALNYSNNPALLLTCLLGAAAGASLFFGFRMLSGLALVQVRADEAHAEQPLDLHLRFAPGGRPRASLRLRRETAETAFVLPAGGEQEIALRIEGTHRGWFRPGRLRVWTEYPLGLFQMWSWLHPRAEFLIYPALESPPPPLPAGDGRLGEQASAGASEEHAGLREYRASDPSRLIAWKPSVRHDTLLVRDVERRAGEALTLDWFALRDLDTEARIRRLAAWVCAAEAAQRGYTLRLPGETIGPGLGASQRQACLRALALLPSA